MNLHIIIAIVTIVVIGVIFLYALGVNAQFSVKLLDRQVLLDGSVILIFQLPQKIKKLQLKIGQQIQIRTNKSNQARQFTPIQNSIGVFKILVVPSMNQDKLLQQIKNLKKKDEVFVKICKNNFQYMGGSIIKVINANKQISVKSYKNLYILAQGNKIPIAYQIVKGICQNKMQVKPDVTVLFVGSDIKDFAMREQFQFLQENYNNVKYFYSIPVKGQRQPSIAGMGISSQKVAQSFSSEVEKTFCILCAQQNDICVTAQRALLNKKVSPNQIYKY